MKTAPLAVLALSLLSAVASHAAPTAAIVWGTPTTITSDADVLTTGSLLYAYSFGPVGGSSDTVNGVTFAEFGVPQFSPGAWTVGSVTLAPTGADSFYGTNTAAGANSAPFTNLSAAYRGLLASAVTELSGNNLTLTLGGLTNGTSYVVEFWANESSSFINTLSNDTKTILTSGNSATLDLNSTNSTGGVGQWVTGTFTASGTSQVITIAGDASGHYPIVNAFELRSAAVPEPSTWALVATGAVALLALRRRR